MARGELMKKLLASYGRDDEFRAVAEQIIGEEEKKKNLVLAKSLRRSLEAGPARLSALKTLVVTMTKSLLSEVNLPNWLEIIPLNPTKAIKIETTCTSAIDHLPDLKTKKCTQVLSRALL